jgi:hypothetical protein
VTKKPCEVEPGIKDDGPEEFRVWRTADWAEATRLPRDEVGFGRAVFSPDGPDLESLLDEVAPEIAGQWFALGGRA